VANSVTAGSVIPLQFSVARLGVGNGIIRAARIFKDDETVTNANFNVHIFSQSPEVNNGDNGAFSPTTMANWLGVIPVDVEAGRVSATDAANRGVPTVAINFDLWSFNATERRLYALLEAAEGYTPASGESFTVTLEISDQVN
jgi:hypothetical protein